MSNIFSVRFYISLSSSSIAIVVRQFYILNIRAFRESHKTRMSVYVKS